VPTFHIHDVFRITDQGYVIQGSFTGDGVAYPGDKVLITLDHETVVITIKGIALLRNPEGYSSLLISFKEFERLTEADLKNKAITIVNVRDRQKTATGPVEWTGDLSDDSTATWAGLMLRAESMDESHWWWAVYDLLHDVTIDSSNSYSHRFFGGEAARKKAEEAAKKYLNLK
jgi:hypothetical protein